MRVVKETQSSHYKLILEQQIHQTLSLRIREKLSQINEEEIGESTKYTKQSSQYKERLGWCT